MLFCNIGENYRAEPLHYSAIFNVVAVKASPGLMQNNLITNKWQVLWLSEANLVKPLGENTIKILNGPKNSILNSWIEFWDSVTSSKVLEL